MTGPPLKTKDECSCVVTLGCSDWRKVSDHVTSLYCVTSSTVVGGVYCQVTIRRAATLKL